MGYLFLPRTSFDISIDDIAENNIEDESFQSKANSLFVNRSAVVLGPRPCPWVVTMWFGGQCKGVNRPSSSGIVKGQRQWQGPIGMHCDAPLDTPNRYQIHFGASR